MGPTETTSIGTVPTSVGNSGASNDGVDIGARLQQIQSDAAMQQRLMREAITPVSGSHVGQIPSALTKPIGEAPQNQTPYERPRSKGEAISNMINSAGNAVSKVITAEKEQKRTHLTDAATKLFTAQAAIDEAQQQHDSATAIGDNATAQKAQQLIDQNTKVRDGITSDPKLRKALAKGLNIDYIDPSNNKTEAHAAVQTAIKNAKSIREKIEAAKAAKQKFAAENNPKGAQNFGAAFAKSQPQTLAPNQMAQAQLAQQQAQEKALVEAYKAQTPREIALLQQQTQLQKQHEEIVARDEQRRQRLEDRKSRLGLEEQKARRLANYSSDLAVQREQKVLNMRNADPTLVQNAAEQSAREWDGRMEAAQARVDAMENNLAALTSGTPAYEKANASYEQATDDLAGIQDQADDSLDKFNYKLLQVGVVPIPAITKPKPAEGGTPSVTTTAPGTGNSFTDWFKAPPSQPIETVR
jgi:uncharacterized protein (UPF0218 family)